MRITCVHQGRELYGSDRSFIESVEAFRAAWPQAVIDVVLPGDGPIVGPLKSLASSISFEPLWILRRKDLPRLATLGLLRLPLAMARAARRIRQSDITYVNTSVIVDYSLAARFYRGRALTHVHEIPTGMVLKALGWMLRASGAEIIFNSNATKAAYELPPSVRAHVIYNGIAGPARPEPMSYDGARPLRVLMLGRISRSKGQEILVEALAGLPDGLRQRVEVRIVGNAYEDEAREEALKALVQARGLAGQISVTPFVPDPREHYRWADIVCVPSRLPESLGRVAIEAMSWGRPPLVSGIGGLMEIAQDGVCGWIVPPDQIAPLSEKLARIISHPEDWRSHVPAARARYEALFSKASVSAALTAVVGAAMLRNRGPRPHPAAALIRDGA